MQHNYNQDPAYDRPPPRPILPRPLDPAMPKKLLDNPSAIQVLRMYHENDASMMQNETNTLPRTTVGSTMRTETVRTRVSHTDERGGREERVWGKRKNHK